jgi:tetratricopeptide (TPR) repeat protein
VLSRLGRFEQAEDLILEALSIRRAILGDDHLDVASGCATLAKLRLATGRPLDAQRLVEEALAIYSPKLAQGHWRIAVARGVLGASLADQGELAAAEELLASSLEDIVAARGTTSPAVRWHVQRLVELFTALGKPDEAERYRSLLRG